MLVQELRKVFIKDLQKLKEEIGLYRNEQNLWKIEKNIANSGGNLCLHLVGNLNTYIGKEIGKTGYVRNRDQEFSLKNIPQKELVNMVDNTITMLDKVMKSLIDEQLDAEYPVLVLKEKTSTGYFLFHLSSHLGYHLGQINYHRRLIDTV
jgi:glucan phosphoethanolaminetransferase (alkaline phosphatase superfamily)